VRAAQCHHRAHPATFASRRPALYSGRMAGKTGERKADAAARKERLARALRENLRRRKARQRETKPAKGGDGPDRA
jgi:hypothetical protein